MSARGAGLALALGLLTLLARDGAATVAGPEVAVRPAFTEAQWPFLRDQWGPGRAFHCAAALCGMDVGVFVRPKSGFCNCYNGVADDDEIDRIGDVDLHDPHFVPLQPGRPARVGAMIGRARVFRVAGNAPRQVLAVVVASQCNALVATVISARDLPPAVERAVLDLLNDAPVQRFIEAASVSP